MSGSALVVSAVVVLFVTFMAVLAWVDHSTRRGQPR